MSMPDDDSPSPGGNDAEVSPALHSELTKLQEKIGQARTNVLIGHGLDDLDDYYRALGTDPSGIVTVEIDEAEALVLIDLLDTTIHGGMAPETFIPIGRLQVELIHATPTHLVERAVERAQDEEPDAPTSDTAEGGAATVERADE